MSAPIRLDHTWLVNAFQDVDSSASSVIVVETSDPERQTQLLRALVSNFESVFHFHPWKGLEQIRAADSGFRFDLVRAAAANEYDTTITNELRDLGGALRHMDGVLRRGRSALVLTGLDRTSGNLEKNIDLINALRGWSLDPEILVAKSVTCLVTAQPANAIDESTLNLAILARPSLAKEIERYEVVRSIVEPLAPRVSEDEKRRLTVATAGLNLHQLRTTLLKTFHTTRAFDVDTVKHQKSDYIRRSDVVDIEEPQFGFDCIGGYEDVKRLVQGTLLRALRNPERARQAALPLPRGILLWGPPGTGKTLFAKALARETSLPFINLRTENLIRSLLGESGQRIQDAIRLVEQMSPAIAFVDEIDRFGQRSSGRGDGASQEMARVFAQILEWLGDENRKAIVCGTTNVPEHLDSAFLRPGRFSYLVPFLYPDQRARLQILRIHLGMEGNRNRPEMNESSVAGILSRIASETDLYAGADLEELVLRAKRAFFQSADQVLTADHLLFAHRDYRVSTSTRQSLLQHYRDNLGPEFTNSMSLLGTGDARPQPQRKN